MAFDWQVNMHEVAALRDDIAKAKRYYKILADVDDDLLTKAQAMAETLGGTELAVAELKRQEMALHDSIGHLEAHHADMERRVAEDIPAWGAELAEKHAEHVAAMDAMEARFQERLAGDEAHHAARLQDMDLGLKAKRDAHAADIKSMTQLEHAAKQKLALVRKAMADLASSAAGG